jgi:hypothetical protein
VPVVEGGNGRLFGLREKIRRVILLLLLLSIIGEDRSPGV